jgi:iron complex outermembrane receptor protein
MLVQVDGRSVYLDAQGEVLWRMIPVTLPEIKRIEVLKGPASVLYGFNAFDGIINIITKSPEEMKGATLQFGGGEFGSITASAIAAGTTKILGKDFGFRLSYGHDQNNKWSDRDSTSFNSNKFNIHTDYAVTQMGKLVVSGGLINSTALDGPIVDTVTVTDQEPAIGYANVGYESQNFYIRGWWQHLAQPFDLESNPLLTNAQTIIPKDNRMEGNSYNLQAQHALQISTAHRFTYGINYRYNTYNNNRWLHGTGNETRLGLYVQGEWRATDWLTATAGIRYDMDTFINPTYSPRGAIVVRPHKDHTIMLSGSMGYRPPTLSESRDRSMATFFGFPATLPGNQNLAPEQIISVDLGYQGWLLRHRLNVRLDFFYNHISDLIGTGFQGATVTYLNGANTGEQGEADIYGIEPGIEFLFTPWLSGFANFSYQDINQTFQGAITRGGPHWKTNGGLRAEFDNGLSGEALVHYVSSAKYILNGSFQAFAFALTGPIPNERVDSYTLLNLRGAYKFQLEPIGGQWAEVAVSAFNALGQKHREHPLGEKIRSLVMGWVTLRY